MNWIFVGSSDLHRQLLFERVGVHSSFNKFALQSGYLNENQIILRDGGANPTSVRSIVILEDFCADAGTTRGEHPIDPVDRLLQFCSVRVFSFKSFVRRPFAFAVALALTERSGANAMVKAKVATCPFAEPERKLSHQDDRGLLARSIPRKLALDATS